MCKKINIRETMIITNISFLVSLNYTFWYLITSFTVLSTRDQIMSLTIISSLIGAEKTEVNKNNKTNSLRDGETGEPTI